MRKRLLVFVLAAMVVLAMIPSLAFADETRSLIGASEIGVDPADVAADPAGLTANPTEQPEDTAPADAAIVAGQGTEAAQVGEMIGLDDPPITHIKLNTEVNPLGQYPVSFELTLNDPMIAAGLTPGDFTISVTAWRNWSGTAQQPVNIPSGNAVLDLSLNGNVLTLYVSGFPERYYLMDAYTVNCTTVADITFTMSDVDEVITPAMDRFSLVEGTATNKATGNPMQFNYYQYVPDDAGTQALPLVLFLHGSTDRWAIKPNRWVIAFAEDYNQAKHPSYVLAPQFEDNVTGRTTGIDANTVIDEIVEVIQDLIDEGKVDPNRVYVVGKSMGGGNTYRAVDRHPTLFAGAFIACAVNFSSVTLTGNLSGLPSWILYSEGDSSNIVSANRNIYNALVTSGNPFMNKRTELSVEQVDARRQGENHGTELHVTESDIYIDWLYSQTKAPIADKVAYVKAYAKVTAQGQLITSIELLAKPDADLSDLSFNVNGSPATVSVSGRVVTLSGFALDANGDITVAGPSGFSFGKSGIRDVITETVDRFMQYSEGMSNGFNFNHSLFVPPITPGLTVGARETRPLIVVLSDAADHLRNNRAVLAWAEQDVKTSYVLAPDMGKADALENALARVAYYRSLNLVSDVYVTGNDADAVDTFAALCPDVKHATVFSAAEMASSEKLVVNWLLDSDTMLRSYVALLMNAVDRAEGIIAAADYAEKYPLAKRTALAQALSNGKTVLAALGDYTDAGILAAWNTLTGAINALAETENPARAELAWWIEYAEDELSSGADYIPAAVTNLRAAITAAAAVLADAMASDTALYAEVAKIQEAMWLLLEKGDKTLLQQLYDLVKGYDENHYTASSWSAFAAALTAAKNIIDNENAVEYHVITAYQALIAAEANLQIKTAVDLNGLQSAIAAAQRILSNKNDYVASSIVGLQGLVNEGNALIIKTGATQSEVNAATDALRKAVAKARLKPDRSPLLSALSAAQLLSLPNFTTESITSLIPLIAQGNQMMAQPDDTVTQAQINALAKQIQDALAALSLKTGQSPILNNSSGNGESSTTITLPVPATILEAPALDVASLGGTTNGVEDINTDAANGLSSAPESSTDIRDAQIPATSLDGNTANSGILIALYILSGLLLAAIAVIVLLLRKRRQEAA